MPRASQHSAGFLDSARLRAILATELPSSLDALLSVRPRSLTSGHRLGALDPRSAREMLVVDTLIAARAHLVADPPAARRVLAQVESELGIATSSLVRGLLAATDLLQIDPAEAIPAQLGTAALLAPIEQLAVWQLGEDLRARAVYSAHPASRPAPEAEQLADRLLTTGRTEDWRDGHVAIAGNLTGGRGALVARADPNDHEQIRAVLAEAWPLVVSLLERDRLLSREAAQSRVVAEAVDRRLTRLGLDVHDGPLQDLAALGRDLGLFRDQLAGLLDGHSRQQLVLGRLDDLEAQLIAADADLRRLAVSLQSPFMLHTDFRLALEQMIDSFSLASGLEPELMITGETAAIGETQALALLTIIREALNNAHEHAGRARVVVSVSVSADGIAAEVSDDGAGFDVEASLMRAARLGRLGLAGMQERVRMLGGRSSIESRRGAGTRISVEMPPRHPDA